MPSSSSSSDTSSWAAVDSSSLVRVCADSSQPAQAGILWSLVLRFPTAPADLCFPSQMCILPAFLWLATSEGLGENRPGWKTQLGGVPSRLPRMNFLLYKMTHPPTRSFSKPGNAQCVPDSRTVTFRPHVIGRHLCA